MKTKLTLAALAVTLGATSAFAFGGHGGRMFDRLDADNSGTITLAEATAASTAHFEAMDKDGNGTVSLEEMSNWRPQRGDRKELTDEERAERRDKMVERRFARLDADDDGAVTLEEMKASAAERGEHMKQWRDGKNAKDGDRDGKRHARFDPEKRAEFMQKRFASLDTDGSGALTVEEFTAQAETMFSSADADGNGEVTKDEARTAMKARFDEMRSKADGKAE